MVFRKLTDEDKAKIEDFRKKYGASNVSSYRALLMRNTGHEEAVKIINNRNKDKENIKAPPPTPEPKAKAKGKAKAKIEEPTPMEVDTVEAVKAPAPKKQPNKKTPVKKQVLKNEEENDNNISLVI